MTCLYLVFLVFIGYIYAQNNKIHPNILHDQLRNHAAKRLVNMSYELVVEAKLLQRQMQPIQNHYQGQITYEIGYVMGKIRERYKRMIEIYKQAHYMTKHLYLDEKNISQLNTSIAVPPGIKMYFPINWVINMEYMRLFEVDIDKLVEVLENIPSYALADIDKNSVSSGNSQPGGIPKDVQPPDGIVSSKLPSYPMPKEQVPSRGPPGSVRTGESPGYPPGDVGFLRSGPPSVLNEPPPSVPNEPPPSVPNEPPLGQTNEPPPDRPNDLPPDPLSQNSPPSFPNESPLGLSNEPPPDPERQSNESPMSQSYKLPPSFPNEAPLGLSNEPPPDPERQAYEAPQSQSYKLPHSFPSEAPMDPSNEPPPDPERQSYTAPQSQSYNSPLSQPYEPLPSPPSWPTEPPAASYDKVIRFGSADTNFRTEEELKQYYRAMYRAKHNGINDKYDNLYR